MKHSIERFIQISLAILLTTPCVHILAQDRDEAIRVDTNIVLINVLVRDKNGEAVRGLKPEQFQVFDDETNRPIESFSSDEAAVSFGIIYDMHPTTDERNKSVIESLRQFKAELKGNDDVFCILYIRLVTQVSFIVCQQVSQQVIAFLKKKIIPDYILP